MIFRRYASKGRKLANSESIELFLSLPQEQAYVIRQKLIEALGAEATNNVRNKIGDAVAEIARQYSDGSACPGVDPAHPMHFRLKIPKLTIYRATMAGDPRCIVYSQHVEGGWATRDRLPNILNNPWYYRKTTRGYSSVSFYQGFQG